MRKITLNSKEGNAKAQLKKLEAELDGKLYADESMRIIYATDASPYREKPLAVVYPKTVSDIRKLIQFSKSNKTSLIPRAGGTSLAGQVVGEGIVVDVSKYMNGILKFNPEERWILVEPGIVRDELNLFLQTHGLFFGPETSTANRATIGGMVGNNSSGSNSISVGTTRDHILEASVVLSDGTEATFKGLSSDDFELKKHGNSIESQIYKTFDKILSNLENQELIRSEYPKPDVKRRNTGYALDVLLDAAPYGASEAPFNVCKILAGSEGTLAFLTSVKLNLLPLFPLHKAVLCAHFNTLEEALQANLLAAQFKPYACELIDSYILECTKDNIEQAKNRFFVEGEPQALLIIEFVGESSEYVNNRLKLLKEAFIQQKLGYHFPVLFDQDIKKVWSLRKAGLGVLSNMPGDKKPITVIEDTAVTISDLESYIVEFDEILKKHGLSTVYYAHAGAGELHMRPILNLKTGEGQKLFKIVATEIAGLVKRYKGSLSGEHGDGRLRSEFIPKMVGEKNYELLKQVKSTWDPFNIFNPGKIIDPVPMDSALRYKKDRKEPTFKTYFKFGSQSILQHTEQCNGSGDCRKSHLMGGTMCPSYMATKNEKDTTRARANILREFLTHSEKINKFAHREIYEVMDLCLSCKGCKSECPSSVDMAKLKAEFLQQYYDVYGVPLRARAIASFSLINRLGTIAPRAYNFLIQHPVFSKIIKKTIGFADERSLPLLDQKTLRNWYNRRKKKKQHNLGSTGRTVYLFCDEFTNYNDVDLGIKAVKLLEAIGYQVIIPQHAESGRAAISKGLLRKAKKIINKNIKIFSEVITPETPLLGIEPSALLSFRDEYPDLADDRWTLAAEALAKNSFTIDEFICSEVDRGHITPDLFTSRSRKILFHGHCQQKAIGKSTSSTVMMSLPKNYTVEEVRSGCCGMAGSFGFEKEHYDLSMRIGNLVLFPTVLKSDSDVVLAASGTSCRQQIYDGTGRKVSHPIEVLYDAYFEANNEL